MNSNNNDGIRYPSIDQLVEITHSKYKLVVGAAKRAKDLNRKENPATPLLDFTYNKKAIGIALEEVVAGKIVIVNDDSTTEKVQTEDVE